MSDMAPPCSTNYRAWTEKMMRHATTEETLEISLELMTSPKLCQFTASLLALLTLLLLLCSLVLCIDLHRSSASESSIIKWESLCWSGLSTVIQLSAALNGTLCDWLDMIWQQKPRKPGLGRALLSLSHINAAHAKRAWERERVSKKWSI